LEGQGQELWIGILITQPGSPLKVRTLAMKGVTEQLEVGHPTSIRNGQAVVNSSVVSLSHVPMDPPSPRALGWPSRPEC